VPLTYRFDILERPELSQVSVDEGVPNTPALRFIPDLPGLYRVQATVSANGRKDRASLYFEVEGEGRIIPRDRVLRPGGGGGCAGCRNMGGRASGPGVILCLLFLFRRRLSSNRCRNS